MSTWPQGPVTPYGADILTEGAIPNIWISSEDGEQKFYIMGGNAPFPGVQDGIICTEHPKGLAPPFKHLDVQGAQQDGVTWQGTVYDPAKVTFKLDVHARTPQTLSRIMNEWMGAWRRGQTPTIEYITPDGGYWTAKARLMPDSWADAFKLTPRESGVWSMTHVCRIEDSFWSTLTSVDSWGPTADVFSDDFSNPTTAGLGPNWSISYTGGHTGYEYVTGGQVQWADKGNSTQGALNTYIAETTATDNQVVSVQIGSGWDGVVLFGEATTVIGGRMDTSGNGVFAEIAWGGVQIYCVVSGLVTQLYRSIGIIPPLPGETWQFILGAKAGKPRSFAVTRGGMQVAAFTESGTTSPLGSSHRHTGFGMTTAKGLFNMAHPAPIAKFTAGDNVAKTASGYLKLANPGTEAGWPELLMYGPGTWSIGNGANSTQKISIGPLADGQVLFLSTLPRRQQVIDMATGQGSTKLQGLVSGMYTNPIPGVATPDYAVPVQIPVTVTKGTATSKIIGSLTPRRVHPA